MTQCLQGKHAVDIGHDTSALRLSFLVDPSGTRQLPQSSSNVQLWAAAEPAVTPQSFQGASALFQKVVAHQQHSATNSSEPPSPHHNRLWYIRDPAAVQPEFLVTLQLTSDPARQPGVVLHPSSAPGQDPLLTMCTCALQPWIGALDQRSNDHSDPAELQQLHHRCTSLLESVASFSKLSQLSDISPAALTAWTGGQQVSCGRCGRWSGHGCQQHWADLAHSMLSHGCCMADCLPLPWIAVCSCPP
jgi:hypothetical protein